MSDAVPPVPPPRGWGLRRRLVVAFVVVGLVSGGAAAFLGYIVALAVRGRFWWSDQLQPLIDLHHFVETLPSDTLAVLAVLTVMAVPLLVVGLALLSADRVLEPVGGLAHAARRLESGQLHTRLAVSGSDELAELVRAFNAMAASLERNVGELRGMEANARRFAGDVSHELRTPLTAMTAVAGVLDGVYDHLPDDAARAVRLVVQETRHLTRLVDDLIEISRFDARTATLVLDDVDVETLIAATLRARGWTGRLTTIVPKGLTARVDPRRLDVIVANLVGNALRHGAAPVTLTVDSDAQGMTITVVDRGPGLPADALPHIFDRFYKHDASRGRSEGSGLGLTIAQESAHLHGGTVRAANDPGGGARFTVHLPAR